MRTMIGVSLLFLLIIASTEVSGSPQPIVALVGDDVILPCQLKPAASDVDPNVEWSRPDLTPKYVHVHRPGFEMTGINPDYKCRTFHFYDDKGDISLKLHQVKVSDAGTYKCKIPNAEEMSITLTVGAVSQPMISIFKIVEGTENVQVVLRCESEGWPSVPEVEWLDSEEHVLRAEPPETNQTHKGYTVISYLTEKLSNSRRFTCRMRLPETHQGREKDVHIPGDILVAAQSVCRDKDIFKTLFIVAVVVIIILSVTLSAFCWRVYTTPKEQTGQTKSIYYLLRQLLTGEETHETSTENHSPVSPIPSPKTDSRGIPTKLLCCPTSPHSSLRSTSTSFTNNQHQTNSGQTSPHSSLSPTAATFTNDPHHTNGGKPSYSNFSASSAALLEKPKKTSSLVGPNRRRYASLSEEPTVSTSNRFSPLQSFTDQQ